MDWFQALLLGILQGFTEYLPVSSSGHLTIASHLLGINADENLTFTVAVHVATVLSTLVILWKEIAWIFKGLFKFKWNDETHYTLNIVISMIPVGIVGVFFKGFRGEYFRFGACNSRAMLLVTALLLTFSYYAKPKQKKSISMKDAFIIGVAQACAVMPGLSRSGSTIATGLLLGNDKSKIGSVLFHNGNTSYTRRSLARCNKSNETRSRSRSGRHLSRCARRGIHCRIHNRGALPANGWLTS